MMNTPRWYPITVIANNSSVTHWQYAQRELITLILVKFHEIPHTSWYKIISTNWQARLLPIKPPDTKSGDIINTRYILLIVVKHDLWICFHCRLMSLKINEILIKHQFSYNYLWILYIWNKPYHYLYIWIFLLNMYYEL